MVSSRYRSVVVNGTIVEKKMIAIGVFVAVDIVENDVFVVLLPHDLCRFHRHVSAHSLQPQQT